MLLDTWISLRINKVSIYHRLLWFIEKVRSICLPSCPGIILTSLITISCAHFTFFVAFIIVVHYSYTVATIKEFFDHVMSGAPYKCNLHYLINSRSDHTAVSYWQPDCIHLCCEQVLQPLHTDVSHGLTGPM